MADKPLTHRRQDNNKRLTNVERLMIMADKQGNPDKSYRAIAKDMGISVSTAYVVCNEEELKTKLANAEHIKKGLTADLYIKGHLALNKLTDERLEKVNAYQNAIIAATCIDKALLIERGSPPTQVNQIQVNVQLGQLNDEIEAMVKKLQPINITPSNTSGL